MCILKEILVNSKAEITILRADVREYKANQMAALSLYHKRAASVNQNTQSESIKNAVNERKSSHISNDTGNLSNLIHNPNRSVHNNHLELLDQSIDRKIRHLITVEDSQSKSAVPSRVGIYYI